MELKETSNSCLSTTEAEYMSLTCAAQQVLWMYSFMSKVGLTHKFPAILHGNNGSSITLTLNTKGHVRAKHINIQHHYIRETCLTAKSKSYMSPLRTTSWIFLPSHSNGFHIKGSLQYLSLPHIFLLDFNKISKKAFSHIFSLPSYWTRIGLLLDSYWTPTGLQLNLNNVNAMLQTLDSYWIPTGLLHT